MFNKIYPRSCTMVESAPYISHKYRNARPVTYYVGSGDWNGSCRPGIFFEFAIVHVVLITKSSMVGFRGSIYVQ